MSIYAMYPAKAGSPQTTLAAEITNDATSITVEDATVLPAAPNICVLGEEANAEIIAYTSISGNTVSGLSRGLGGTTPQAWIAGTAVARNFTSFDHDTFKANIESLEASKAEASNVYSKSEADSLLADKSSTSHTHDGRYYTESEVDNKLSAKANLASPALTGTPTAPTAASGTNTTQIATTAFVQSGLSGKAASSHTHDDRYYTESEMDTKLSGKANSSHSHDDRYYTETEMDSKLGGKANSSHSHGAGDITSGTLGTARGGTGNSSVDTTPTSGSTKMVTSGGVYTALSGKAASSHNHAASNITSGTLAVARGGTGGSDSGWQDLENSTAFSGTIRYRKVGIYGFIQAYGIKLAAALASGSNVDLGSGIYSANGYVAVIEGSGSGSPIRLHVGKTGTLVLYNVGSASIAKTTGLYFSGMYFCG